MNLCVGHIMVFMPARPNPNLEAPLALTLRK